jgi:hypothetical protein
MAQLHLPKQPEVRRRDDDTDLFLQFACGGHDRRLSALHVAAGQS